VSASFSIEDIAKATMPGMSLPTGFAFDHDRASILYLKSREADAPQGIFSYHLKTHRESVVVEPPDEDSASSVYQETHAEALYRQRVRQTARGITSFQLSRAGRIIYLYRGDIYALTLPRGKPRKLFDHGQDGPAETPHLSPDGQTVAFVQDGQMLRVPFRGRRARRLSPGKPREGVTYGRAEYLAQEEFHRFDGFWWSSDGQRIALLEVDERHIPLYHIAHLSADHDDPTAGEAHRYPFAGRENARVRLGVISAGGGEPSWLYDTREEGDYLAQVFWRPDDQHQGELCIETLDRDQTQIDLICIDPKTGERTPVLRERARPWLNLNTSHPVLLKDGSLLWLSEQTGFAHVALYDAKGKLARWITSGDWVVDAIEGVDEENSLVYVTGNRGDPTQRHVFAVPLAGGDPKRLTPEDGTHQVTLDRSQHLFVDVWSALDQPPRVQVRDLTDGRVLDEIPVSADRRVSHFGLEPPTIVTVKNRTGTTLYGALYLPPAEFGKGPFPTVVEVYGGPGPQMVTQSWSMTAMLRSQYLRQHGLAVFKLDNRGSARRGVAFESAIGRRFGTVEVEDQVDGVEWLVRQDIADPRHVGIIGWSYGGYMTLMCLAKASTTFRVGVAGAPVTEWEGYDSGYTERYMSTPAKNPKGYKESSALTHADKIAGKLLLIHGLLDENVHFRHTARLIDRLNARGFAFDTLILPGERHMLRDERNRRAQIQRSLDFLMSHL
jgi:dipeptidyl-peptidase-4